MSTTLKKVQVLENYLAADNSAIDSVLELAIDKLLHREIHRVEQLKERLSAQIKKFEQKYGLSASDFYARFSSGEMGDEMDFIEWAATIEMLTNTSKRLTLLSASSES